MTKVREGWLKALSQQDLAQKLNVTGALQPLILTPPEFATLIRSDHEKDGKIVKAVGAKAD